MVKIKRLTHPCDLVIFQTEFNKILGYSTIPFDYFDSGECYAMFHNGEMEAGFCLIPGYYNLRSIKQLPFYVIGRISSTYLHGSVDFTGYFIKTKNRFRGLLFTLFLVKTCFFSKYKYFFYSYATSELGLERYYGSGNPVRVHTGIPEYLPGHHQEMPPEHVEVLTRWGIVKIFIYRTVRIIKALINKLFRKKHASRR